MRSLVTNRTLVAEVTMSLLAWSITGCTPNESGQDNTGGQTGTTGGTVSTTGGIGPLGGAPTAGGANPAGGTTGGSPPTTGGTSALGGSSAVGGTGGAACGNEGQLCCSGSKCNSPSTACRYSTTVWENICVPCGESGQACCGSPGQCNDPAQACGGSGLCEPCGGLRQVCCQNSVCTQAGTGCQGGTCQACGTEGLPCCQGRRCDAGCCVSGGPSAGRPMCVGVGRYCGPSGSTVECQADGSCGTGSSRCGGLDGICCDQDSYCTASGTRCLYTPATLNYYCRTCGGLGQPCCEDDPQVNGCASPYFCSAIMGYVCTDHIPGQGGTGGAGGTGGGPAGGTGGTTGGGGAGGSSAVGLTGIAARSFQTCVVASGALVCWGRNVYGQLGTGSTASEVPPARVRGATSGVTAVACGEWHTCAVINGGVWCWGDGRYGQLGHGATYHLYRADTVISSLAAGVTALGAGSFYSCAGTSSRAYCWGDNPSAQLGNGTFNSSLSPVAVSGITTAVSAVTAGVDHTCAIVGSGAAFCWGSNAYSQLPANPTDSVAVLPVPVKGLGSGVTAITAGTYFTCAIVNGGAQCWGDNRSGQLGNGTSTRGISPVQVSGLASGVTSIAAGAKHACAVKDGSAYCWGLNDYGQLGNASTTPSPVPVQVHGLPASVTAVAVGDTHSCAIASDSVYCWGSNAYGELGYPRANGTSSRVPVQVTLP